MSRWPRSARPGAGLRRARPAASGSYKVCLTFQDGWRCIAVVRWWAATRSAKPSASRTAMIERVKSSCEPAIAAVPGRADRAPRRGDHLRRPARTRDVREVVCKIGVEHEDRAAWTCSCANEIVLDLDVGGHHRLVPALGAGAGDADRFLPPRPGQGAGPRQRRRPDVDPGARAQRPGRTPNPCAPARRRRRRTGRGRRRC